MIVFDLLWLLPRGGAAQVADDDPKAVLGAAMPKLGATKVRLLVAREGIAWYNRVENLTQRKRQGRMWLRDANC